MVDFDESLFSSIPLAFVYSFDSCSVLNGSSLVCCHLLIGHCSEFGLISHIWPNFGFLIIFRYLGEAILELGH